jgi:cyclase
VNTHHHGDHTYGNWLLPPSATIVAHRSCRAEMLRAGLTVMQLFPGADYGHVEVAPPTLTFEDRVSIWADDLEVQVIYVGPAHTTGDCIIWVPARSVAFAGDLVFNGGQPLLVEGCAANYPAALDRLEQLDPRVIVPGHGPAGGQELLAPMRRYAQWLNYYADDSFQAGLAPLEAARRADLGEFATWSEGERLVANIERAYSELRGEPWGTPLELGPIAAQMAACCGHQLRCLA